jgi:uncharacterized membrane protein YqaE (UPF0057 family)
LFFFIQGGVLDNKIEKQNIEVNESSLVAILLSFFLPPLGVFIKTGFGLSLLINILLTFLGFIPGIVHALYVILNKNK